MLAYLHTYIHTFIHTYIHTYPKRVIYGFMCYLYVIWVPTLKVNFTVLKIFFLIFFQMNVFTNFKQVTRLTQAAGLSVDAQASWASLLNGRLAAAPRAEWTAESVCVDFCMCFRHAKSIWVPWFFTVKVGSVYVRNFFWDDPAKLVSGP